MSKKHQNKRITAKALAEAWGVTEGRISQLVAEGMPLASKEIARQWRRARWTPNAGEIPAYLLSYRESTSIEQRVYDGLVYVQSISPEIAAAVAMDIFMWNPLRNRKVEEAEAFNPQGRNGADRPIDVQLASFSNEPIQPTWWIPILAADREMCTPQQGQAIMKRAQEMDRKALREEGILK